MLTTRSEQACFGGTMGFYSHASATSGTEMRFGVFAPPSGAAGRPVLYYLAGLTCTEETFLIKAGAQALAAELGIVLVAPDTSPRGLNLPGEDASWDFGVGAGFYVDAVQAPWAPHYRMYSYVTRELPELVEKHFGTSQRRGITGHSMGGHGALVAALREPTRYQSVSAFAPICNPVAVPWGEKAFGNYVGQDRALWAEWDASLLMRARPYPGAILVDQGLADKFLEPQLHPEELRAAALASGQSLELRTHAGYDHSYWFVQTFTPDHLRFHAARLL
jgi:S-formylglutathione hydrolase